MDIIYIVKFIDFVNEYGFQVGNVKFQAHAFFVVVNAWPVHSLSNLRGSRSFELGNSYFVENLVFEAVGGAQSEGGVVFQHSL